MKGWDEDTPSYTLARDEWHRVVEKIQDTKGVLNINRERKGISEEEKSISQNNKVNGVVFLYPDSQINRKDILNANKERKKRVIKRITSILRE